MRSAAAGALPLMASTSAQRTSARVVTIKSRLSLLPMLLPVEQALHIAHPVPSHRRRANILAQKHSTDLNVETKLTSYFRNRQNRRQGI